MAVGVAPGGPLAARFNMRQGDRSAWDDPAAVILNTTADYAANRLRKGSGRQDQQQNRKYPNSHVSIDVKWSQNVILYYSGLE